MAQVEAEALVPESHLVAIGQRHVRRVHEKMLQDNVHSRELLRLAHHAYDALIRGALQSSLELLEIRCLALHKCPQITRPFFRIASAKESSRALENLNPLQRIGKYRCEFWRVPSRARGCSVAPLRHVRILSVARQMILKLLSLHEIAE